MKKTPVNFRLDSQTLYNLEFIQEHLGIDKTEIVTQAIDLFVDCITKNPDEVNCDFHDCLYGINNSLVQTFIEQVNEFTIFKTFMYGNGDQIIFKLKEEP